MDRFSEQKANSLNSIDLNFIEHLKLTKYNIKRKILKFNYIMKKMYYNLYHLYKNNT